MDSRLKLITRLFLAMIAFGQIFSTHLANQKLIYVSSSLYSHKRTMVKAMVNTTPVFGKNRYKDQVLFRVRLNMTVFFELIVTKKPFKFNLGTIGKIDHKNLLTFVLCYSAMAMTVSQYYYQKLVTFI